MSLLFRAFLLAVLCFGAASAAQTENKNDMNASEMIRLADAGDKKASRYIGIIYEQGLGVKKDYALAVRYFSLGDERDDITSQYHLGKLYESGLGVKRDYKEAMRLYMKNASRIDHVTADTLKAIGDLYVNGLGVPHDMNKAKSWYEKAKKARER